MLFKDEGLLFYGWGNHGGIAPTSFWATTGEWGNHGGIAPTDFGFGNGLLDLGLRSLLMGFPFGA